MASYFDIHAADYDDLFTNTPVGTLQRKRVYDFIYRYFPRNRKLRILEINCGTGTDAFYLVGLGHEVTATDASIKMIEACLQKKSSYMESQFPRFLLADFTKLAAHFQAAEFDAIFSNFGGLNCIGPEDITRLSSDLARLLKPGGQFAGVVMGRKCIWEKLYFYLRGDRKSRQRRNSGEAIESWRGDTRLRTWYYSPGEFSSFFQRDFNTIAIRPVGLFIPPSYLNPFFSNKKFTLSALASMERLLPFSSLADYGDHFLILLQRKT